MIMTKELMGEIERLPDEYRLELSDFLLCLNARCKQPEKIHTKKFHITQPMKAAMLQSASLRALTGLLHTNLTDKEIRAERLKKYECAN